jgi:hypothetical protein
VNDILYFSTCNSTFDNDSNWVSSPCPYFLDLSTTIDVSGSVPLDSL